MTELKIEQRHRNAALEYFQSEGQIYAYSLSEAFARFEAQHMSRLHYCNKCGFFGKVDKSGVHNRPKDGEQCNYFAALAEPAPAAPDEVKKALILARQALRTSHFSEESHVICEIDRALAAIGAKP